MTLILLKKISLYYIETQMETSLVFVLFEHSPFYLNLFANYCTKKKTCAVYHLSIPARKYRMLQRTKHNGQKKNVTLY